jgi:pimeloyl-ACP methyl ester carboxylesterase
MGRLKSNGIGIEYETFGDAKDAPMLLIMGLGAQMTTWDDDFCKQLSKRGFHVIRFDNRDVGLSDKMDSAGMPDIQAAFAGDPKPAYSLDDMADDAVGVLDALGISAAHIVGASMGGFITQLVGINHPKRALSLTSIMSHPGGEDAVAPLPEGLEVLIRVPPQDRQSIVENSILTRRVLAGAGNPFDEAKERVNAERAYDRSYYPAGMGRQLVAVLAAKGRLERLSKVKIPTLVIHGLDDVLIPPENGRRVAAAVPGANLLEFEGMGHNIPEPLWPQVFDAIQENARRASKVTA